MSLLCHTLTMEPNYTISVNNSCRFDLVLYIVSHKGMYTILITGAQIVRFDCWDCIELGLISRESSQSYVLRCVSTIKN